MKNTPKNIKENNHNIAIAAGITGLFASALLGAHFLFNTEKGKKSLKHIKSWSFKMKGELLEKLEKVKEIDEAVYTKIVDESSAKYQKIKGMTIEEISDITKELKSNWKKIKDEAKKAQSLSKGKSKPAVKKVVAQKSQKPQQNKTTSWSDVSEWYDDYLKDEDNYQHKVILPNLLRLINIKDKDILLDLGCGQGFFIEKITDKYKNIDIYGIDLSSKLLKIAEEKFLNNKNIFLKNTDAINLSHIKDKSIDKIYSVLALQNMSDVDGVIKEIKRVLKNNGRCLFVINHPSFRVPKESDWRFDNNIKKQGRLVFNYMTDKKYVIDLNPGFKAMGKKTEETISFHHPLQYFSKIFNKHSLAIARIEEWISHKKSEEGSGRQLAEDNARKEIPMFMCLELISIAN